jgi:hypothetical protein
MYLNMCRQNTFYATMDTTYISTCVDQTYVKSAVKQKLSQLVLIKPVPCQRCITTCVDQTTPMPARTENISKHVLNKPIPYQRGHKMYLNLS